MRWFVIRTASTIPLLAGYVTKGDRLRHRRSRLWRLNQFNVWSRGTNILPGDTSVIADVVKYACNNTPMYSLLLSKTVIRGIQLQLRVDSLSYPKVKGSQ